MSQEGGVDKLDNSNNSGSLKIRKPEKKTPHSKPRRTLKHRPILNTFQRIRVWEYELD
jgi:hypothetical protein